ncbi:hypothetical protein M011DRAFT_467407 [Sporormia fimetaria CBS 119925]|uniref:Uncharacterized protein n=1 Tax=Sporormia fimetaria CBS 119925 TaxID=1340428 RepID=A0A6A6VB74_9PLEO|nr:hypothetical protein M011DRAFT_467407 [Sporormia fimetaria CBS 119925]
MDAFNRSIRDTAECARFLASLSGWELQSTSLEDLGDDIGDELRDRMRVVARTRVVAAAAGAHCPLVQLEGYALGSLLFCASICRLYEGNKDWSLKDCKHEFHTSIGVNPHWNTKEYPIERKVKVTILPRIVAGVVLLKVSYSIIFYPGDGPLYFAHIAKANLDICPHVSVTYRPASWYDNTLANEICKTQDLRGSKEDLDDDIDHLLGPRSERNHISLRQCPFCETEYEAFVRRESIDIDTWHNLGDPLADGDQHWSRETSLWRGFAGTSADRRAQECVWRKYELGSVRGAFEGTDGVGSVGEGSSDGACVASNTGWRDTLLQFRGV